MKRIQGQTESDRPLTKEQADILLQQILDEIHPKPVSSQKLQKKSCRRIVLQRYFSRRIAAAVCAVLAVFLLAPGTVIPAAVSHVSAAPASNAASMQISFQVDTLIPVQEVTAQINEHSLPVESNGYQKYQLTVEENGWLLLDICSVTGMRSSHKLEISGIDTEAPTVISHEQQNGFILIYVSDGDGVGVDYDAVTAYTESDGNTVSPAWCDESFGCVAFSIPDEPILIQIPDKNGNYRILSLSSAQ